MMSVISLTEVCARFDALFPGMWIRLVRLIYVLHVQYILHF